MPKVDRSVIKHRLNISPDTRPIIQKKRNPGKERSEVARAEVRKLLESGFIREVLYPKWLANTVMVRKSPTKWQMCGDYTDLNKSCPKDLYPLPDLNKTVDATLSTSS